VTEAVVVGRSGWNYENVASQAMAARIAALQEAEAMADTRIQKVKGKVDKVCVCVCVCA
jgi:hypothetical protein